MTPLDIDAPFAWSDMYLVGDPGMDDTHREFVHCLEALRGAPAADRLTRLDALIGHAEAHFAEENEAMARTAFPARGCHVDEHAAVLASLHGVRRRLAEDNDAASCERLIAALMDWFPAHTDHLDSALAHWLCARRAQGKPVVLRRNILASPDIT